MAEDNANFLSRAVELVREALSDVDLAERCPECNGTPAGRLCVACRDRRRVLGWRLLRELQCDPKALLASQRAALVAGLKRRRQQGIRAALDFLLDGRSRAAAPPDPDDEPLEERASTLDVASRMLERLDDPRTWGDLVVRNPDEPIAWLGKLLARAWRGPLAPEEDASEPPARDRSGAGGTDLPTAAPARLRSRLDRLCQASDVADGLPQDVGATARTAYDGALASLRPELDAGAVRFAAAALLFGAFADHCWPIGAASEAVDALALWLQTAVRDRIGVSEPEVAALLSDGTVQALPALAERCDRRGPSWNEIVVVLAEIDPSTHADAEAGRHGGARRRALAVGRLHNGARSVLRAMDAAVASHDERLREALGGAA